MSSFKKKYFKALERRCVCDTLYKYKYIFPKSFIHADLNFRIMACTQGPIVWLELLAQFFIHVRNRTFSWILMREQAT